MKQNKNPFSSLSGIMAIEGRGNDGCLLVDQESVGGRPIQVYAFNIYFSPKKKISRWVKVTSTCGFQNCVKKEHLKAVYSPKKEDLKYIKDNGVFYTTEELAFRLKVPEEVMRDFFTSNPQFSIRKK